MLVEVSRKAYLASIVPVIVNAILNEHQIIVDIVAFVNKGDFPRSRLGEKQRGKILAGWVSRKMRTIAQFAIKDMDSGSSVPGQGPPGTSGGDGAGNTPTQDVFPSGSGSGSGEFRRASIGSFRSGGGGAGVGASSLRNSEAMPQPPRILEQRELEDDPYRQHQPYQQQQQQYPGAPVEMPADELNRDAQRGFVQSPEEQNPSGPPGGSGVLDSEQTPTKPRYSSQGGQSQYQPPQYQQPQQQQQRISGPQLPHGFELPDFDQFGNSREASFDGLRQGYVSPTPPPPNVGPKPGGGYQGQEQQQHQPLIRLPGVDGRESLDDWDLRPGSGVLSETSGTLMGNARPPSGLATRPLSRGRPQQQEPQDDWARDAFLSMNLAGRQG